MLKANKDRPNCYGRKLGVEACFHTCSSSDRCYGIDKKSTPAFRKDLCENTEYNYHALNKKR